MRAVSFPPAAVSSVTSSRIANVTSCVTTALAVLIGHANWGFSHSRVGLLRVGIAQATASLTSEDSVGGGHGELIATANAQCPMCSLLDGFWIP
jgi:hypothetical protein